MGGIVFVFVRHLVVPASFGAHGAYRFDNVAEQMAKAVVHGGRDACADCHKEQRAEHAEGKHASVSCEVCHGPVSSHAQDSEKTAAMPVDRSAQLCRLCHQRIPARPKDFPQVDVEEHGAGQDCVSCHSAHGPFNFGSLAKAGRSIQGNTGPCGVCHSGPADQHASGKHAGVPCKVCHGPLTSHIENSKKIAAMPIDRSAELCAQCHQQKPGRSEGFPQVDLEKHAQGKACVNCHSPHEPQGPQGAPATQGGPPSQEMKKSCLKCHEEMEKTLAGMKHLHAPVAMGRCAGCHTPYDADHKSPLLETGNQLCFRCHGDVSVAMSQASSVHEPASEDCQLCHDAHGGEGPGLLTDHYSENLYNPFSIKHYALCFKCHDRGLVTETTSIATQFRNGDRNLHHVHVNMERNGRSCRACHVPHAADVVHLIRAQVPFGGSWRMPLRYSETPNGGMCLAGCHQPLAYDRLEPIQY